MAFSLDDYLNSFLNWESRLDKAAASDFGLERVHRLLEAVGHPEDQLKFVHVAGSKGKGSTCAFLASILRSAGYRVGLFTSPHFNSYCERIRILEPGGVPAPFEGMITLEDLTDRARFYQERIDVLRADGVEVTFFELWTALALTYFSHKKVDIVVLETGLGGRLDATNAVDTLVCGITPIGLEHTAILGGTLQEIALEKAGIIKSPSQKVSVAGQAPEVIRIFRDRCEEFFIAPTVVGEDVRCDVIRCDEEGSVFFVDGRRPYSDLVTSLPGRHQVMNAALAIAMAEDLEIFGFLITEEAVSRGIRETRWPGRFEIVCQSPRVILDCAHTPESALALAGTFAALYPGRKAAVVLGMSADKNVRQICQALSPIASRVIWTRAGNVRALDPLTVDIKADFPTQDVSVVCPVSGALEEARRLCGAEDIILVCGSVFVVAEARKHVSV